MNHQEIFETHSAEDLYKLYGITNKELFVVNGVELEYNPKSVEPNTDLADEMKSLEYVMLLKQMEYFCQTLKVDFAGYANIKNIAEYSFSDPMMMNPLSLMRMKEETLVNAIGVNGSKLYESLHKALKTVDKATLYDALGLFGRGIGSLKLQKIIDKYGDLVFDRNKLLEVDGWAEKTVDQYLSHTKKYTQWEQALETMGLKTKTNVVIANSDELKGIAVVFTGVRDKSLEEKIKSKGGKVLSSCTKECNMVITKDVYSTSSKITKARQQGAEIISYDDALKRFV